MGRKVFLCEGYQGARFLLSPLELFKLRALGAELYLKINFAHIFHTDVAFSIGEFATQMHRENLSKEIF